MQLDQFIAALPAGPVSPGCLRHIHDATLCMDPPSGCPWRYLSAETIAICSWTSSSLPCRLALSAQAACTTSMLPCCAACQADCKTSIRLARKVSACGSCGLAAGCQYDSSSMQVQGGLAVPLEAVVDALLSTDFSHARLPGAVDSPAPLGAGELWLCLLDVNYCLLLHAACLHQQGIAGGHVPLTACAWADSISVSCTCWLLLFPEQPLCGTSTQPPLPAGPQPRPGQKRSYASGPGGTPPAVAAVS